jgi:tetratricopeptide (TPR) repeat protein
MRKQILQLCLIMLCHVLSMAQSSMTAAYQNQAASLLLDGQYEEAIQALELAAEAHKTAEEWPHYFSCLNQITNAYLSLQNHVEAKRMAKATLWESISILGRDNNESAKSAHQLAEVYSLAGRFSKAEEYHLMGLKIRRSIYGEEHPDIADSYCKLAKNLARNKAYKEAEKTYQQALQLQKRLLGENHSFVANTLYALGMLSSQKNDLEAAELYHLQSLKIREKTYGKEHNKVAQSYFALSQLDEDASNNFLKSAADIYVLELSETSIEAAVCLFQYSKQLFDSGIFDPVSPYVQKAVGIFNAIGRKHQYAAAANHLMGTVVYEKNRPNEAIQYFKKAVESKNPPFHSYHLLINAHHQLHQYEQAGKWLTTYYKRAKTKESSLDALLLLADNQLAREDWEAVYRTLNKAKKYKLSSEAKDYIALQEARLQFSQQHYEALIQESAIAHSSDMAADLVNLQLEVLKAKAEMALAKQGRSEVALLKSANDHYHVLHGLISTLLKSPLSPLQHQQLNILQTEIYENAIECNYLLYEQTQEPNYINTAFSFSEKSKALQLSLQAQNNRLHSSNSDSRNQNVWSIVALNHQIKANVLDGKNSSSLKEKQEIQMEQYSDYLDQMEQASPEIFSLLFEPAIVPVNTIYSSLASSSTNAISYFWGEKSLYIFTIQDEKPGMYRRDISSDLQTQIKQFSRLCQQSPREQSADELNRSFQSFIQYATRLQEILLPLSIAEAAPNGPAYHLLILPHESLIYFPFEALCFKEGSISNFSQAPYIGNHIATLYHYSASRYLEEKTVAADYTQLPKGDKGLSVPHWNEQSVPLENWIKQDTAILLINRFVNEQDEGNIINDFLVSIQAKVPAHIAIQLSRLKYLEENINKPLNAHPYYWAGYCFIGKPATHIYTPANNNFPLWILAAVGGIVLVGLWVRKK